MLVADMLTLGLVPALLCRALSAEKRGQIQS